MVRLVFRPYTQVRRTVWTLVSLRASTRVSSCFAPLRHTQVRLARTSDSSVHFSRLVEWGAYRPSPGTRGCHEGHRRGRAPCVTWLLFKPSPRQNALPGLTPPAWPATVRAPSRMAISFRHSASSWGASQAPIRFPPENFKHSLTLFSKSFSSFPRDTCSLSIFAPFLSFVFLGARRAERSFVGGSAGRPRSWHPQSAARCSVDCSLVRLPAQPDAQRSVDSVDRGSKATVPLTMPCCVFKSSAKDSTRRSAGITLRGSRAGASAGEAVPPTRAHGSREGSYCGTATGRRDEAPLLAGIPT